MIYKQFTNNIASKVISKSVHNPEVNLMVGSAEVLQSLPVITYKNMLPTKQASLIPNMSEEEVKDGLANGRLTVNDFFQNKASIQDAL